MNCTHLKRNTLLQRVNMSTEHSLKGEIDISKSYKFWSFCCAVVLANTILVLNLSLVVSFFRKLQKCHEVVVYVINFSPTLNESDISYNTFGNVENIWHSRTLFVLRIYYKDKKNRRTSIHENCTEIWTGPFAIVIAYNNSNQECEMF